MITTSEYRDLPLASLAESANNPRRSFDEAALNELAESIRTQGILAPLVVRPVNQHFEIVAGARRFRAAQIVGLKTAPVRIVELSDAQALEASIIELSIVVKRFLPFVGALHVVDMSTTCRVCV